MTANVPERTEKIAKFAKWLSVTTQLFSSRMEKNLEKYELTQAQFSMLNHLSRKTEALQKISDIARAVEAKQPAVTKTVRKFEALGWVTITGNPKDQRIRYVTLTDEGRAHLARVQRALAPDILTSLQNWKEDEIDRAANDLQRFARWLDENRLD